MKLLDYASNTYSQCGEDGILAKLVEVLNPPRACVEFGAGDGKRLSNTARLIEQGWQGVLIEGDPEKYERLCQAWDTDFRPHLLQAVVGWEPENCMDTIVLPFLPGPDLGILSIDIDGNEWPVWDAVRQYKPRIVVVEFNPRFPPFANHMQTIDMSVNVGSSLVAIVQLGKVKGYELAAATDWNAIFVTAEDFPALGIADNRPQALWWHPEYWTWEAHGYDGRVIRGGLQRSMWPARDGRYAEALPKAQPAPEAWHGLASGQDQYGQVKAR